MTVLAFRDPTHVGARRENRRVVVARGVQEITRRTSSLGPPHLSYVCVCVCVCVCVSALGSDVVGPPVRLETDYFLFWGFLSSSN